jgi:hypothetical protein
MWILSPQFEKAFLFALLFSGLGLLRRLFRNDGPEIKEPETKETKESIRGRDRCRICGHPRAFHQKQNADSIEECLDCKFMGKNPDRSPLHNFELQENPK